MATDDGALSLLGAVLLIPFRCYHNDELRYVWIWDWRKYREAKRQIAQILKRPEEASVTTRSDLRPKAEPRLL